GTVGRRQTGQVENCQVMVFCAYATDTGRALIDREAYVPAVWTKDAERCRDAKIPRPRAREVVTKPELGRRMVERCRRAGVPFGWVAGGGLGLLWRGRGLGWLCWSLVGLRWGDWGRMGGALDGVEGRVVCGFQGNCRNLASLQRWGVGAGKAAGHGGCSPRVRGWSLELQVERREFSVLPACAGVVLYEAAYLEADNSAPRVCGGGPVWAACTRARGRCSPRVRGWPRRRQVLLAPGGVFSVYAGVVPPRWSAPRCPSHAPCACGGVPSGSP
ncbi:transposase, partial [Streptomyces albidoflavus]